MIGLRLLDNRISKTTEDTNDWSYTMCKYIGQWELYDKVNGAGTITQERETVFEKQSQMIILIAVQNIKTLAGIS